MIKVGIFGSTGRVGRLLVDILQDESDARLSVVFVRKELQYSIPNGVLVTNDLQVFLQSSDLVIDFSTPQATQNLLDCALDFCPKPIVIGTTGLNEIQLDLINAASQKMPILYATNMSRGVFVLNNIARIVASALKESDIEIVEIHHHHKKDSPSGTALTLAESVAKARDLDLDKVRISGRDGAIGARSKDEIAVMSLRGGDVAGRHTIGFYMDGEYLELTHNATSRMTFAKGAIEVGKWLFRQSSGLYSIKDALKL